MLIDQGLLPNIGVNLTNTFIAMMAQTLAENLHGTVDAFAARIR